MALPPSKEQSYATLLERLKAPHPAVQKFAVKSLFDRLRSLLSSSSASSLVSFQQLPARDAGVLAHCLSSSLPAVVDQAVSELSRLVKDGVVPSSLALQELQAVLDGSSSFYDDDKTASLRMTSVVRGIGRICRDFLPHLDTHSILVEFGSWSTHPFVKALQSQHELCSEILQQVVAMLATGEHQKSLKVVFFLEPLFNYVFLQQSESSNGRFLCRQLHFCLVSMSTAQSFLGHVLLRLLIRFLQHYPLQNAQDVDMIVTAATELVDALECMLNHEKMQIYQLKEILLELLGSLIGLCHELKDAGFNMVPVLALVKHVIVIMWCKEEYACHLFDWKLASLAYLLASAELEQEQVALLGLARIWLQGPKSEGCRSPDVTNAMVPTVLFLIFPVVHAMSSPCNIVKREAMQVLIILRKIISWMIMEKMVLLKRDVDYVVYGNSIWGHSSVAVNELLHTLWFEKDSWWTWNSDSHGLKLSVTSSGASSANIWMSNFCEHLRILREKKTSSYVSIKGHIQWLCMLVTALMLHPSVGIRSCEAITTLVRVEPIYGLSLLPVVLFYLTLCKDNEESFLVGTMLEYLKVLPSLACHSITSPMISQTLQPMLDARNHSILRATTIRLLCQTWKVSDKSFSRLQAALQMKQISSGGSDELIDISVAASLLDVCKKDVDRGVDVIILIQECIEQKNSLVRMMGLESLSSLCESDSIDFYTAWLVLSKLFVSPFLDPAVAISLCKLWKYGALDADSFPEIATEILHYLWEAASMKNDNENNLWCWVRANALKALSCYEVHTLEKSMVDESRRHVDVFLSETSLDVLQACEDLIVKFLLHEHENRRRFVKEERHLVNKVEKLLTAIPQILFPPGDKRTHWTDFPDAALLCMPTSFDNIIGNKKKMVANDKGVAVDSMDYQKIFFEAADNMHISGNLVCALISQMSWSTFMNDWIRMKSSSEKKLKSSTNDVDLEEASVKAAKYIAEALNKILESTIPRVADNAILGFGVLCEAMPSSAHMIRRDAIKYLEYCLSQEGHESMQVTAALSLGLASKSLHSTDWSQKLKIVDLLLQHAIGNNGDIVKGACCLAVGFVCQSLVRKNSLTEDFPQSNVDKEKCLLAHIILTVAGFLSQIFPWCSECFQKQEICKYLNISEEDTGKSCSDQSYVKDPECDFSWFVFGLVAALGSSVTAIERAGSPILVSRITKFLLSSVFHPASFEMNGNEMAMVAASFLVLPTSLQICLRLEILIDDLHQILQNCHAFLLSGVEKVRQGSQGILLMSACVSTGNILSTIIEDGTTAVSLTETRLILEDLQNVIRGELPGLCTMGGMIGLANSFGACAGFIGKWKKRTGFGRRDKEADIRSEVLGGIPLLLEPKCQELVHGILQDLLGIARGSSDVRLKSAAGWSLSLCRKALMHEEEEEVSESTSISVQDEDPKEMSSSLASLPHGSTVRMLCSWLQSLPSCTTNEEAASTFPCSTAASTLRCLQKAPRLPDLDWHSLLRNLMRGDHARMGVRSQCVLFALSRASKIPSLTVFLDDLCHLSRLRSLEASVVSILLHHLGDLCKLFSQSRTEKLLYDLTELMSTSSSTLLLGEENLLRISFWAGLKGILENIMNGSMEAFQDTSECLNNCIKKSIELLLDSLSVTTEITMGIQNNEWAAAVDCISKSSKHWMLQFTEVVMESNASGYEVEGIEKLVILRSLLVANGSLQPSQLKKHVMCLLRGKVSVVWNLIVVASFAMKNIEMELKRQWIIDAIEIACVADYPETAVHFISLLVSNWNISAPLLILTPSTLLQDLPYTLPSFLLPHPVSLSSIILTKCIHLIDMLQTKSSNKVCSVQLVNILRTTCINLRNRLNIPEQSKLAEISIRSVLWSF